MEVLHLAVPGQIDVYMVGTAVRRRPCLRICLRWFIDGPTMLTSRSKHFGTAGACAALAATGFRGRQTVVGIDLGTTYSVIGVNEVQE